MGLDEARPRETAGYEATLRAKQWHMSIEAVKTSDRWSIERNGCEIRDLVSSAVGSRLRSGDKGRLFGDRHTENGRTAWTSVL